MKTKEWLRIGGWVTLTSKYLEEVLPQLDYYMCDFIDDGEETGRVRFIFTAGTNKFVRNVVLPEIMGIFLRQLPEEQIRFRHAAQSVTLEYKLVYKVTHRLLRSLFRDAEKTRNRRRLFSLIGRNDMMSGDLMKYWLEQEGGP